MKFFFLTAVIVLLVILFSAFDSRRYRRRIDKVFEGRESLTPEGFYEAFYKDKLIPECIVLGVIKILEDNLDADLSRLHVEDDFSKNLSFILEFDSLANVEIVMALEKRFSIKIENNEAERANTVGDIIELVASKLSNA